MYIGSGNTTRPPDPRLAFAEVRIHQPILASWDFDQRYHHLLFDRYIRPQAGYTGVYCAKDFFEHMSKNNQFICLTLNLRDDLNQSRPYKFRVRPIEEYVAVAKVIPKAFKQFRLRGFVNLWSEFWYRYILHGSLTKERAVEYIRAVKEVLAPHGILVGAPGEEYILQPEIEAIQYVARHAPINILTFHSLASNNAGLDTLASFTDKPLADLESGSQTKDYRDSSGVKEIEKDIREHLPYAKRMLALGLYSVDSNSEEDKKFVMRMWSKDYQKLRWTTPTSNKFIQLVEKHSDRLPEVIKVPDWVPQDGRKINFDPALAVLTGLGLVTGKHDPREQLKFIDWDWVVEKELRDSYGIQLGVHYPRDDGSTDEQVRLKLENLAKNLRNLAKW